MNDSDRADKNMLRRIYIAVAIVFVVGIALLSWTWFFSLRLLREQAYQMPPTQCEKQHDCDERALRIQAREAVTSDAAFDVAFAQAFLGFCGLAGVAWTIFYARQAWREAKRSADAAHATLEASAADGIQQSARFREQMEHSRETTRRQLRPYVGVKAANYNLNVQPGGANFGVGFEIENFGQTPAYNFRTRGGLFVLAYPTDNVPDLITEGLGHPLFPSMNSYISLSVALPPHTLAEYRSGAKQLIAIALTDYEDVFGARHHTRIVYRSHPSCRGWMPISHGGTLTFEFGEAD